ncbi:glycosyltransferase [Flavobacterium sp. ZT3R17]|uniref:glycosyltransferase n=1 Tax=Flavobacterium cryoconiti TaxID=3398736 RepID=UPI003A87AD53
MKILMVAIPNHHFFQWVNQLKDSGYEVFWFDISDGGSVVAKISWVRQIKGWKLKWVFPFRNRIKSSVPKIYSYFQKYNEFDLASVFEQKINEIQPDIVHCFEMNLSGLPILNVMNKHKKISFIYSSWGSDMFYFKEHGIQKIQVALFLERVDYLITDCKRDYRIAVRNGFKNKFIGVFPGNGGVTFSPEFIQTEKKRNIILVKGYESFGCKASKVIEALQLVPITLLQNFEIVIYSADEIIIEKIKKSAFFDNLKLKIYPRAIFIANEDLLKVMGVTCIHISNNISDGMPNTLLESMGMGAFPIQSNPGNASEEVISHGVNGYLITDPLDGAAIAVLIEKAINNPELRIRAQEHNVNFIQKKYNRSYLKKEIVQIYQDVFLNQ